MEKAAARPRGNSAPWVPLVTRVFMLNKCIKVGGNSLVYYGSNCSLVPAFSSGSWGSFLNVGSKEQLQQVTSMGDANAPMVIGAP